MKNLKIVIVSIASLLSLQLLYGDISLDTSGLDEGINKTLDIAQEFLDEEEREAERLAEIARANASTSIPPLSTPTDSSTPKTKTFGNYECTFKCFKFGGILGLGKKGSPNNSINVSASSNNNAQVKSHTQAKKICNKMGYDGVLSQWGTGSTDCSSK